MKTLVDKQLKEEKNLYDSNSFVVNLIQYADGRKYLDVEYFDRDYWKGTVHINLNTMHVTEE